MKACVVGKAEMQFVDDKTGEAIEGANIYYFAVKDEVDGYFAGRMWVKKSSKLYHKVMSLDTQKPFMADLDYDVQPGRRMQAVLQDIIPLEDDELARLLNNPYWCDFVSMISS